MSFVQPFVHRRTLLASLATVAGTGLAGACTPSHPAARKTGRPVRPDPQLADLAAEHDLLGAYDATIAAHPDLAARLGPLRAHHFDHVTALEQVLGSAAGGAVPSPAASGPVTLPTSAAPVPPDPAAALSALREAEHRAATARARSCLSARPDRAALLGSIAACEASHEVLLG